MLQEILTFPLVLATNVASADLLRAYQGQSTVELGFRRAENPAAVAPVFLETPTRIAALGCVYVMALLVYNLVERHVRKCLVEQGETLPDRAPSQPPTAPHGVPSHAPHNGGQPAVAEAIASARYNPEPVSASRHLSPGR